MPARVDGGEAPVDQLEGAVVSEPYNYERQWAPRPVDSPVWRTQGELLSVLDQYRRWYEEGLTDVQVSERIRALQLKHNPRMAFRSAHR